MTTQTAEKLIVRTIAKAEIVLFCLFFWEISKINSFMVAIYWIALAGIWEERYEQGKQLRCYAWFLLKWAAAQSCLLPLCMILDNFQKGAGDFGSRFWLNMAGFLILFLSFLWLIKLGLVSAFRCFQRFTMNSTGQP